MVGTDQNVISVSCHCCSLLHAAVSCCNQDLLKRFKKSPDFWVIDFICRLLWLWNNHHFLFYLIFKKFENNIELSSILPRTQAKNFLSGMDDIMWWFRFDSFCLLSAFKEEILTRCYLPGIDKCNVREVKKGRVFCLFCLSWNIIPEWGRKKVSSMNLLFSPLREGSAESRHAYSACLRSFIITHYNPSAPPSLWGRYRHWLLILVAIQWCNYLVI